MPEIVIQGVGVAMEEALLVRWLKQPGETIAVDDIVAEIDTDKATMDVVSPYAGTLGPHLAAEGDVVPVGAAIVEVLDGTEQATPTPAETGPATPSRAAPAHANEDEDATPGRAAPAHANEDEDATPSRAAPAHASEHEDATPATPADDSAPTPHRLSPRARRLAAQQEAPAHEETQALEETQAPETATAPALGSAALSAAPEAANNGRFRELIATKVVESWREIPHFTVSREVNAQALRARLTELRDQALEPTPTLTDLLLVALARAVDGNGHPVDLGLAVATDHGVVIPVVRDVLSKTPVELASARQRAIDRARAGKLSEEDLSATPASTLSNLGNFGVDRFTGIVATGQTSLLTVGRVRPRVVVDEGGEIGVQMMFDATLNADHRAIDGAEAARLLVAFATASEATIPTT